MKTLTATILLFFFFAQIMAQNNSTNVSGSGSIDVQGDYMPGGTKVYIVGDTSKQKSDKAQQPDATNCETKCVLVNKTAKSLSVTFSKSGTPFQAVTVGINSTSEMFLDPNIVYSYYATNSDNVFNTVGGGNITLSGQVMASKCSTKQVLLTQ